MTADRGPPRPLPLSNGPGAYQITLAAFVPRYTSGSHKGQCNLANNAEPLAKGAVASFLAAGVITLSWSPADPVADSPD